MEEVMHLVIKKDYAASLIKQLVEDEAIELIEEEAVDIPEHQKKALLDTLDFIEKNPDSLIPWGEVKKEYKFLK